eukprot:364933-Chlamydomonas_euryale.AAC.5
MEMWGRTGRLPWADHDHVMGGAGHREMTRGAGAELPGDGELRNPLCNTARHAQGLLSKLKQECTLLVVSHDLREVAPLVDTAWEMRLGGTLGPAQWPPPMALGKEWSSTGHQAGQP